MNEEKEFDIGVIDISSTEMVDIPCTEIVQAEEVVEVLTEEEKYLKRMIELQAALLTLLPHQNSALNLDSTELSDKTQIVDVFMSLIGKVNEANARHVHTSSVMDGIISEKIALEKQITKEKQEKSDLERKYYSLEVRKRAERSEMQAVEKKLRLQYKELDKNNNILQRRDTQYQHKLRQSETQFRKLQDRYQKVVSSKEPSSIKMQILNGKTPIVLGISQRTNTSTKGGGKSTGQKEKFAQKAAKEREERIIELMNENIELRESFISLENEFDDMINQAKLERNGELIISKETENVINKHTNEQYKLPFSYVKDDIEAGLQAKIQIIKDNSTHAQDEILNDDLFT